MYEVKKIGLFNIMGQFKANKILYDCGKDMVKKYELHHWDNSTFKNFLIIIMCELKNEVYIVTESENPIATFQIKKNNQSLHFEKLACSPKYTGKGVGSYCINCIEDMARKSKCNRVSMEVYSPSKHAIEFYLHRGYNICGKTKTLKYSEVIMEKNI